MTIDMWRSYIEKPLNEGDIVKFKGLLEDYSETTRGSARTHHVIILNLQGVNPTFKISNLAYQILMKNNIRKYLEIGKEIEIGTTKQELLFSENIGMYDRIMNNLIDNRINPQVYYFNVGDISVFDLKEYNERKLESNKSNLKFMILFCGFSILLLGFVAHGNWKTRFEI